ncbi:BirA protein [Candidatus Pantoea carbekii]|uniref:Bifunctional ligase/repressor BirA n=1 Tax=Candidatus Pantoea carbekii TaxID=1235990 RepID=U3U6R7_9GAMM|nr:BirA protein [Candidatus Pantoea carbekii]
MKNHIIPLKLVALLADGKFHSSQQLAHILDISRADVNKHIQTLKSWGLDMYTVYDKGYSLSTSIQLLDQKKIFSYLNQPNVSVIPVINSTNQYLLDRIDQLSSGDACIAEYQQAGRGRRGKKWLSPFGTNLYLSMYWYFKQKPVATMGLSVVIAIVIAQIIQSLGTSDVRIKWPNDLYLDHRKLAGILVELTGQTTDSVHIVIGVGMNLFMNTLNNLKVNQNWISLHEVGMNIDRNALAAKMLNSLRQTLPIFEQNGLKPFMMHWESLDDFMNQPITLLIGESEVHGIARGINEQGALLLEENGKINSWIDGEISLNARFDIN